MFLTRELMVQLYDYRKSNPHAIDIFKNTLKYMMQSIILHIT